MSSTQKEPPSSPLLCRAVCVCIPEEVRLIWMLLFKEELYWPYGRAGVNPWPCFINLDFDWKFLAWRRVKGVQKNLHPNRSGYGGSARYKRPRSHLRDGGILSTMAGRSWLQINHCLCVYVHASCVWYSCLSFVNACPCESVLGCVCVYRGNR